MCQKNPTEGASEASKALETLGTKIYAYQRNASAVIKDLNARYPDDSPSSQAAAKRNSVSSPVTQPPARTHSPSPSEKNSPRVHLHQSTISAASAVSLSNQSEQDKLAPKTDIATSGNSLPKINGREDSSGQKIALERGKHFVDSYPDLMKTDIRHRLSVVGSTPPAVDVFSNFYDKEVAPLINQLPASVKAILENLDEYTKDRLEVAFYEGYLRNAEDLRFAAELLNRMQSRYLDMLKLNATKAEELQAELLDMLNGLCNGKIRIEDLGFIADKTSPEDQDATLYHALRVDSSVWPIIRKKNMSIDNFIKVASASTPAEQRKIASGVDPNWFGPLQSCLKSKAE